MEGAVFGDPTSGAEFDVIDTLHSHGPLSRRGAGDVHRRAIPRPADETASRASARRLWSVEQGTRNGAGDP